MARSPFRRDPVAENEADVRSALRARLARKGAAKEMAELLGFSEAYISDVKHGHRAVPPKVAFLLGFKRVVVWSRVDGAP